MRHQKIFIISLFLVFTSINAQTVNEVFARLNTAYSMAKPLQFESDYTLYKNTDSKLPHESYKGVFAKNAANEIYHKIDNTEMVSLKEANIKIIHSEKTVMVSDPVQTYKGEFDIRSLKDLCTISSFKDYKTHWEIILVANKFSSLPYSKIILQVSKDYLLKKQVFYYNTAINFSSDYRKNDTHYPRLEINYRNYNRNAVKAPLLKKTTYFLQLDSKQILLAEKLKKYEIADNRGNLNVIINK